MRIDRALVVTMFLAAGLSACAAKGPAAFTDADRTAIRAVIDSFTTAVKASDYATAVSYYTDDAVFMGPNAPAVEGRAGIQKAFDSLGRVSAFSQPVVEIDGVGDLAYARLNADLTFTPPGTTTPMTDKSKVLIVMRKQADGKWRTSRGMVNSDLPMPGPPPPKR
jgi:uncharacterized protein (TIGR02246 family)